MSTTPPLAVNRRAPIPSSNLRPRPSVLRSLVSNPPFVAIAVFCGCATSVQALRPEAETRAVLEEDRRFWLAASKGPIESVLKSFAEDGVLEAPDGSTIRGHVALGVRMHTHSPNRLDVVGLPEHSYFDPAGQVIVTGRARWVAPSSKIGGGALLPYLDVWRWSGTRWQLVLSDARRPSESQSGHLLVMRAMTAWSGGNWAELESLLAPECCSDLHDGALDGSLRKRFDAFHRKWIKADIAIDEQFTTGDRIVTRATATLTDASTGQTSKYIGLDITRVRNGRLAEWWDVWHPLR